MAAHADVAIVGGGIVGTAIADRLAAEGRSVALFEAGPIGRGASWAGAGILSPVHPWSYPPALFDLVHPSWARWPGFAAGIARASGVDVEFRRTGLLWVFDGSGETAEHVLAGHARFGIPAERIGAGAARRLEPALGAFDDAVLLPEVCQVRNPRVPRALAVSAARRGALLHAETPVHRLEVEGGRVRGLATARGRFEAEAVVLASGAWTRRLVESIGLDRLAVDPVKGQIVLLETPGRVVERVILHGDRYLVPRADGRLLVGSTIEPEAGFDTRPTAAVVAELTAAACRLVPALEHATFVRAWAGLRPANPRGLPFIGPVAEVEGLWLAAGHYRNGLLLAPITAELVADLLAGRRPAVDPAPYAP